MPTPRIQLLPATEAESDFWYETKKITLGAYISQTFGWDETAQLQIHAQHFIPGACQIIWVDGARAGGLSVSIETDYVHLAEIMLLPAFQRQGLGTHIVNSVIAIAQPLNLPVRLLVLRVNPVQRLYKRLGFVVLEEAPGYLTMEHSPSTRDVPLETVAEAAPQP